MKKKDIHVDKSNFDEWQKNPITILIFQLLKERMDFIVDQILNNREASFDDYCKNQWRKGVIDGYSDLLTVDFVDLKENTGGLSNE